MICDHWVKSQREINQFWFKVEKKYSEISKNRNISLNNLITYFSNYKLKSTFPYMDGMVAKSKSSGPTMPWIKFQPCHLLAV